MECLLESRVIFWLLFENLRKFLQKSQICSTPLTSRVAKPSAKKRNNTYHKLFDNQKKNIWLCRNRYSLKNRRFGIGENIWWLHSLWKVKMCPKNPSNLPLCAGSTTGTGASAWGISAPLTWIRILAAGGWWASLTSNWQRRTYK